MISESFLALSWLKPLPTIYNSPPTMYQQNTMTGERYSQMDYNSSKCNNIHIHNVGKLTVRPGQLKTWKTYTGRTEEENTHTPSLRVDEILHQTSIIDKTATFTGKEDHNYPKSACEDRIQPPIHKSTEERSAWVKPGSPVR